MLRKKKISKHNNDVIEISFNSDRENSDEENSPEKNTDKKNSDEENLKNTNTTHILKLIFEACKKYFYKCFCIYKNG